jgi:hypothetical protein
LGFYFCLPSHIKAKKTISMLQMLFRISKVRNPLSLSLSLWNKVLRSLENNLLLYFRQKSILMNATLTAEKNSLLATQCFVRGRSSLKCQIHSVPSMKKK